MHNITNKSKECREYCEGVMKVKVRFMKAYGEVDVYIDIFLTAAVVSCDPLLL
jgi:hypothetical protein